MNLAFYIYKFLREREMRVSVPQFGVFSLEKKHAIVDEQSSRILPPSERVSFEKIEEESNVLAEYISVQTEEEFSAVQKQIRLEVEKWNQELFFNKKLVVDGLGVIDVSGDVSWKFTSKELVSSMDYFGLEAINLQEIKEEGDYLFKRTILWGFMVVAPLVALVFLGIRHQDLIFGKASFENTHRIKEQPKPVVKVDSLVQDSLVVDSVNVSPKEIVIPNK